MEILNKWTIVLVVATLLSLLVHWCKISYLDPILELEDKVKSKVKRNTMDNLSTYEEKISSLGYEEFIDVIYDEIAFQKMVREAKHVFRRQLISSCLFLASATLLTVTFSDFIPDNVFFIIFTIIGITVLYLWGRFDELKKYEKGISEYIDGRDPTMILTEIENR